MIRILLVDDQPAVQEGLCMQLALETDLQVVGVAGNGQTALALAAAKRPDVVILDLEMPGMDGIATAAALCAQAACSSIVILSIHTDITSRTRALAAGAVAYIEKTSGIEPLLGAVRMAATLSPK